jgi:hypothetical protein
MKKLWMVLFALALPALGQNFTQIVASKIQDQNGALLASGTLYMQGVDQDNLPTPFAVGGGGQALVRSFSCAIAAGTITTSTPGGGVCQVPNPASTSPTGILYRLWIVDNTTKQQVLMYPQPGGTPIVISGSSWSLDNYQPSGILVPAPPVPASVTGPLNVNGAITATGPVSAATATLTGVLNANGGGTLSGGFTLNGTISGSTVDPNAAVIGALHSPMLFAGLTDFGRTYAGTDATSASGSNFQSAARFSVYALKGGVYGGSQTAFPILNGEALGRTKGQVGGLFSFNLGYGQANVQGASGISTCYGGAEPTAGGSYVQCSPMGEQDITAATLATTATIAGSPAPGATAISYTPLANESVAGARQWFDISRPEIVGTAAPTNCGIGSVSGTTWTLTGSGCAAASAWVGEYIFPNTEQFWYAATAGACTSGTNDYTTDGTHCIATPYLVTSVGSTASIGTFATLDSVGLVDMKIHAAATGESFVRKSNVVTGTLAAIPRWLPGDSIVVSGCADSSFDGTFTLTTSGATSPVDTQVVYPQTAADATTSGCSAVHAPIPFIVVDGILANDVDITTHVLTLPANTKSWAAGDSLVSPPTPWMTEEGVNFVLPKNYPVTAANDDEFSTLGEGVRIRSGGPFPLQYGIEFYPPITAPGGVNDLLHADSTLGPVERGFDVSEVTVSDCVVCIGASNGTTNKIKWGPHGSGVASLYWDGTSLQVVAPEFTFNGGNATFADAVVSNSDVQSPLFDCGPLGGGCNIRAVKSDDSAAINSITISSYAAGGLAGLVAGSTVGGQPIAAALTATTATITPGAIAANSCYTSAAQAVAGATIAMVPIASPSSALGAGFTWSAWVSSAGNVEFSICNATAGALTPAAAVWNLRVIQ